MAYGGGLMANRRLPISTVIDGGRPEPVGKSRVRASEAAIKATLKAMRENGISIARVCITGGKVEIHPGEVEAGSAPANTDGRIKPW